MLGSRLRSRGLGRCERIAAAGGALRSRVATVARPAGLLACPARICGRARAQAADTFRSLLEALWPEAQAMGVSRATFDAALRGVEPDLTLPDLVLPGQTR